MSKNQFELPVILDAINQLHRVGLLKRNLTEEQQIGYTLGVETSIHLLEHCLGLSDHPESECSYLESLESDGI
jgi:hypothetical protein